MSSIRTVVVDDEKPARVRLTELLQREPDVEMVGTGSDGREALDLLRRVKPDLLFLDVQMPELDGLGATRQIRARWPDRPVHIVAMTANAMAGDRDLCIAAGMNDYVSKPIRPPELAEALARAPIASGAAGAGA